MAQMPVKVPLLDLEAQYRPLRDEILAAITRVCDSQRFIMGPEITALEGRLDGAHGAIENDEEHGPPGPTVSRPPHQWRNRRGNSRPGKNRQHLLSASIAGRAVERLDGEKCADDTGNKRGHRRRKLVQIDRAQGEKCD